MTYLQMFLERIPGKETRKPNVCQLLIQTLLQHYASNFSWQLTGVPDEYVRSPLLPADCIAFQSSASNFNDYASFEKVQRMCLFTRQSLSMKRRLINNNNLLTN